MTRREKYGTEISHDNLAEIAPVSMSETGVPDSELINSETLRRFILSHFQTQITKYQCWFKIE